MSGRFRKPHGYPGVVERPSQMSGRGRDALPEVREWLRVPPECLQVVERPSRLSGSGREAIPDVLEWSGDPAKCEGVVGVPPGSSGGITADWE